MIYSFDEYELDIRKFELRRGGIAQCIERQVFAVLVYLLERRDRVVTKRELLDSLWGDRIVTEASLSHSIMKARRVIGDDGRSQRTIKTVHGRGYRFTAEVSTSSEACERRARSSRAGRARTATRAARVRGFHHARGRRALELSSGSSGGYGPEPARDAKSSLRAVLA